MMQDGGVYMSDNSYRFFNNQYCDYFPCHMINEEDKSTFNCLFCFCPLYFFKDCGGVYTYTDKKAKDCSQCLLPHQYEFYIPMMQKLQEEIFKDS